jgi:hypothetical protein
MQYILVIVLQDTQCTYNVVVKRVCVCCRAKAISITYSEDVFAALRIQHAMCMRRIYCHLRSVRLYDICQYYLINGTIFDRKE